MNVFYNTIVFVKDINKSKKFYTEVIGLKIVNDYQTIVFFENHFTIHNGNNLLKTVFKRSPLHNFKKGKKNIELYFETDNIEKAYKTIIDNKVKVIHAIEKQAWGQKVFRFYDPDNHLVEIGEAFHLDYLKKNSV
jgi:catechol 2,3-dioxygenase-like lactoylglutathione lyase family enzyme